MTATELASRIEHRIAHDEELVIDPALFHALAARNHSIGDVDIRVKPGRAQNEMTQFRYDVVLTRAGGATRTVVEPSRLAAGRTTSDDVRAALAGAPPALLVAGLRNDRLVREAALLRDLADAPPNRSVSELRTALTRVEHAMHPDDLASLDGRYDVAVTFAPDALDEVDALFLARADRVRVAAPTVDTAQPWSAYTNQPARRDAATLAPELRAHLRASLPDHMVPSAFVVLDALPRTPNGKIDRNALPAPDRGRVEGDDEVVAPATAIEVIITTIWQDILSLDAVSVETNLFVLGANSLMMVRASTRLSEALGRRVSLVDMFGYPTVRALAAHLEGTSGEHDSAALEMSHERGESRKELMRRRREVRRR
jgi:hypothetical protein